MIRQQIQVVEAGLARLGQRLEGVPELELVIGRLLVFLGRDISALGDRSLRRHGLTETDFRVLMVLFSEGGTASPTEISTKVVQSAANMTRIADHLVALGLITRTLSETDRRRWLLELTAQGKKFVDDSLPALFAPIQRAFADLPLADRKRLLALLKSVAAAVDEMHAENAESGS